ELDHNHYVSTLILQEDTITQLEQAGAIQAHSEPGANGRMFTEVTAYSPQTLARIRKALELHEIPITTTLGNRTAPLGGTHFTSHPNPPDSLAPQDIYVPIDYAQLRTLGLGLPPDGIEAAKAAGLRMAGRIGNFPGVTPGAAENVLRNLS